MDNSSAAEAITRELMDRMLDEIAPYSIDIEEDPTQIHLGIPYLQKVLAKCRSYTNRVQFYMQKVKRYENGLRSQLKVLELDLEFKMREKLADDSLVRKQPSIEDRKALAATMLAAEHRIIAELKVELLDAEETYKIIRGKHLELQRTSNDIKTQRNLVKDDMLARLGGHEGYNKPQVGQDKSIPEGLPPPVQARIDPKDILDPTKRPEDMPEPIDAEHAAMLADFMNGNPIQSTKKSEVDRMIEEMDSDDLKPSGTLCSVCKEPQMHSPGGLTCKNGHGGVDPLEEVENHGGEVHTVSYEDLLS